MEVAVDLEAQVVLIIEPQNQLAECIANIPRNSLFTRNVLRREVPTLEFGSSREATPAIEIEAPSWELRFDRPPLRNGEWVFGSSDDPEICDFQLATDQQSGVSRRQFKIYHNRETGVLLICNLSKRGTYIRDRSEFELLRETRIFEPNHSLVIRAGALQLQLTIPDRTKELQLQMQHALQKFINLSRRQVQELSTDFDSSKTLETPTPALATKGNFDLVLGRGLGSGHFGAVQLGIEKRTGEVYAVKVINKKKLRVSYEDADKRLSNEKALASKVVHNNIVRFHKVIDEPDTLTIVMDFAKLGDLHKHMQANRFSLQEVHIIATQQCSAIAYLHKTGITHRDIKPGNILLDSRKPLMTKLADFGESTLLADLQTYSGTEAYQAPEIEEKMESDIYTNKVDVWSLGLVLVQLLEPETKIEQLHAIPEKCTGTLAGLCQSMLLKEPLERATAQQCCDVLLSNTLASWNNPDNSFHRESGSTALNLGKRENTYTESITRAKNPKQSSSFNKKIK